MGSHGNTLVAVPRRSGVRTFRGLPYLFVGVHWLSRTDVSLHGEAIAVPERSMPVAFVATPWVFMPPAAMMAGHYNFDGIDINMSHMAVCHGRSHGDAIEDPTALAWDYHCRAYDDSGVVAKNAAMHGS